MRVHGLHTAPGLELSVALERFEKQFTYPLGPGRYFRITHGEDYPRFFRAMGEAACFVAERDDEVLGVIGAVLRRLLLPSGEELPAVYLGDLKMDPRARGGRALLRLVQAVTEWVAGRAQAAFGVVMDGTAATPPRYTGRLGIPLFQELGKIMVLRISTNGWAGRIENPSYSADGSATFLRLSAGRYASLGGEPGERSEMEPLWLMAPNGQACGRLEDTRRAKRLIGDDGMEMRSAHLSCFAYQEAGAGVALLEAARQCAGSRGFPALFVAVAASDAQVIGKALEGTDVVIAPATVFGFGLEPGPLWNLNTAEI